MAKNSHIGMDSAHAAGSGAVTEKRPKVQQQEKSEGTTTPDLRIALIDASIDEWNERTVEERREFIKQINDTYHSIVDEFFDESNSCVTTVVKSNRSHILWRRWLIVLIGGLAILNLTAAYKWQLESTFWGTMVAYLPLFAAVYAAILVILGNLESFHNFLGRAQAYRESREIFLDAYREFEMQWHIYVRPFGDSSQACVNASELYRRLVIRDNVLRSKVKELTETKRPGSEK